MPTKKRRPAKRSTASRRKPPVQRERLVESFRTWRTARGLDPEDAWIIGPLFDLKDNYFDLPDPTVWPERPTYELVTQVMPGKVHIEQGDHERIAPTIGEFFTFLHETGRWSPRSLPFEDIPDLVGELTDDIPELLADPGNRGMAGNIVSYALSQGVDLTDQAAMATFIESYNSLDDDARRQITDTGRLAGSAQQPGAAFGLGAGHLTAAPDWEDEEDDAPSPFDEDFFDNLSEADVWPDFLGDPLDSEMLERALEDADEAYLTSSPLMQRADQVMALISDGREVTDTQALRPSDTRALLQAFGLDLPARSMWDAAAVAMLWVSLRTAGFVEIRGGTPVPQLPSFRGRRRAATRRPASRPRGSCTPLPSRSSSVIPRTRRTSPPPRSPTWR